MDYREEALEKLKHNNVSAATMDVWIAGYIAGREESEKEIVKNERNADAEIERLREIITNYKYDHSPEDCTTLEALWFNRGVRFENNRVALLKYEAREFTPEGEYESDFGYVPFKDLQENL